MSKTVLSLLALLAVACLIALSWVRFAPHDPSVWHLDPIESPSKGRGNAWWVVTDGLGPEGSDGSAPSYALEAVGLAWAVEAFALAQPLTTKLAGAPDLLMMTYVQRSKFLRFPDYITVRTVDLGNGGSGIAVWSRSRFGQSDFGVNRRRVEKLLAALQPFAR